MPFSRMQHNDLGQFTGLCKCRLPDIGGSGCPSGSKTSHFCKSLMNSKVALQSQSDGAESGAVGALEVT